ncbi:MAG: hypothetical protein P3W93_003705 [Thermus sp.]|nr:hypothetical protein [Thermus sp.]
MGGLTLKRRAVLRLFEWWDFEVPEKHKMLAVQKAPEEEVNQLYELAYGKDPENEEEREERDWKMLMLLENMIARLYRTLL